MKRICCTLLAAALLLSACTAASAQSSGQSLSELFEGIQKDEPASVDTYVLGADELASIPAIVGQREWVPPLPGEGEHHYAYRSGTVSGDLIAYIDYLGGLGFEVVRGASLSEPGDGELVAASKDAGQQLHVGLSWRQDGYSIRLFKSGEQDAPPVADIVVKPEPAVTEAPDVPRPSPQPEQNEKYQAFLECCEIYDVPLSSGALQAQVVSTEDGQSVEYRPLDGVTVTYYYDSDALSSISLWIDASVEAASKYSSEMLVVFVLANDPLITSAVDMITSMVKSAVEISEGLNFASTEMGRYSYSLLLIPSEGQIGMHITPLE